MFTSTDGGSSWKALPIPNSLRSTAGKSLVRLMPQRAIVAKDGSFLMATFADGAGPHTMAWDEGWGPIWDGFGRGAVLKYDVKNAKWENASPENLLYYDGKKYDDLDLASGAYQYTVPYGGIAINPNNSNEIVVTTEGYGGAQYWKLPSGKYDMDGQWGTQIYYSTDAGKTWVQSFAYNVTTVTMDENGIGWMNNSSIHWSGSAAIDPFDSKRVFVSSGNGVFRTDDISAYTLKASPWLHEDTKIYDAWGAVTNNQVWKVSSHGIEETVPYEVVSISEGPLVSVIADYDGFRHDDIAKYPSKRHVTKVDAERNLGSTYSLAYAYKSGKLVKLSDKRVYEGKYNNIPIAPLQYSNDSAASWSVETYTGPDTSYKGGTVAISADGDVAIWSPEGSDKVFRNYNSTTWDNATGISANAYVVSDPENEDVFYAYEKSTGAFYKSSDKGKSFAKVSEPGISQFKKFRAIPGYSGDLWLPVALQDEKGNPKSGKLLHSTDAGATWKALDGVDYCEAVGFGAPKEKGKYPAIYVFATIKNVTGVFASDDSGKTWTRINDDAHEYGGLANGEFVMGDMNTYGVVYMSTAGRGIAARVPSSFKMGSSESKGSTKLVANELKHSNVIYLNGNLNLTLKNSVARISVFDLKGQKIYSGYFTKSVSIPVSTLVKSKGSYIVRINSEKETLFAKKIAVTNLK